MPAWPADDGDGFGGGVPDIRGDRREGVDGSLRCGFGSHQGTTIAYAAQTGERITRPGAGPRPSCSG